MGNRGHSKHGPKRGGAVPLLRSAGNPSIQCGLRRGLLPYQVASSSIQPFGHNSVGCHSPRGGSRGVVGFGRTSPQTDAPRNQRYEMIVDKLFRKVYEQRRARRYEKAVSIFLYPRATLASAGIIAIAVCPSVRPSIRLSQVGVLLKRLNVRSRKQHHTVGQGP